MHMARVGTGLLAGLLLLTLTGCPKDPYDAETWIDKLEDSDPKEVQQAVTRLAELKDPRAIKPLGALWRKTSKSSQILRTIIQIAEAPKNKDGKDTGTPAWSDAVPILVEALQYTAGDNRSIEDAVAAADALGRAKDPGTVGDLIQAVNPPKPLPITDPGQNVRIAAMRALGNFGNDPRAVDALVKVLQTDPLDDENRDNPDAIRGTAFTRGAAANALGATRNPNALGPLVIALFQIDIIFPQVRGALTRYGAPAIPELLKVLKGEHAEVNKFAKENNFANDCTKGEGPGTTCIAPGALVFKSAVVLGDLRAKQAVPALIEQLKKPAKTSFFGPGGVPGSPDHTGVLDALRKIGDESAAPAVLAVMEDEKTDDVFVRPQAIDVYSMMSRDTKALDYLSKQIKSDEQEEGVRKAAGLAYARLVRTKDQLDPLDFMIDRYAKESKEKAAKAAAAKKEDEKEDLESQASGYRDLSTLFWQHKVRALVGVKCGDDVKCYLAMLAAPSETIITEFKIPAPIKLAKDDKDEIPKALREAYQMAAQERALMEIAKMGPKAAEALPTLLKLADSTDRLVREGVMLALVRVAKIPCNECQTRLDEVIKMQEDQQRLDDLTKDTKVIRDYFAGAAAAGPAQ